MSGTQLFDKRTLRERCTAYVRDLIVSGRLKPGEHLIETKLSDEIGVSRGTLREALRPLHNEGLLVDDGRGHLSVRELTEAEIREVFEVRAALEVLAAVAIARRDDRQESAGRLEAALEPLLSDGLSFGEQIAVDLGFHELLCRLSGNETLVRSWRQLVGQIEMMIIAVGQVTGSSRMRYEDHVGIIGAIRTGDEDAVRRELDEHMSHFAERYTADYARAAEGTASA